MSALANAFKRAAGIPEEEIKNDIQTPYYGRKVVADAVTSKLKEAGKSVPVNKTPKCGTVVNSNGYSDYGYYEGGVFRVVCSDCQALKTMNTGNGTACYKCTSEALQEMAHDYRTKTL